MAIGAVKPDGNSCRIYDESLKQTGFASGQLVGYTNKYVTTKDGSSCRVYDEKGHQVGFL